MQNCFLCNSKSSIKLIDHDNRYSVQCGNDKCGFYEIAIGAVDRIKDHLHLVPMMMEKARLAKARHEYAEFLTGKNGSISI
jgi:hypothetical protein